MGRSSTETRQLTSIDIREPKVVRHLNLPNVSRPMQRLHTAHLGSHNLLTQRGPKVGRILVHSVHSLDDAHHLQHRARQTLALLTVISPPCIAAGDSSTMVPLPPHWLKKRWSASRNIVHSVFSGNRRPAASTHHMVATSMARDVLRRVRSDELERRPGASKKMGSAWSVSNFSSSISCFSMVCAPSDTASRAYQHHTPVVLSMSKPTSPKLITKWISLLETEPDTTPEPSERTVTLGET